MRSEALHVPLQMTLKMIPHKTTAPVTMNHWQCLLSRLCLMHK